MVRKVVLADHDFDVHAEIVLLAQDFDHATARILRRRRPIGKLDVDHYAFKILHVGVLGCLVANHAVGGHFLLQCSRWLAGRINTQIKHGGHRGHGRLRVLHPRGDDDFLGYFLVDRLHVILPMPVMEDADDGRVGA